MLSKDQNFNFICLDNTDSTNKYLKNLCDHNNIEEGTVILAEYQNEGKGQGKNAWHSKKGKNLLASILFKPSINAVDHFMISEFISLGIIDTLNLFGVRSEIKWPNDIYAGDKKIAGILVENSIMGKTIFQTVAGIGLNVNEDDFPEYLPNPTSIKLQGNIEMEVKEILTVLMKNLFKYYELIRENKLQKLHDCYNSSIYLKNQPARFHSGTGNFSATIVGVAKSGELQLRTEDGKIKDYLFGEIQMII
jgi:BirA family biotin operon repressor/biotin-[acetyl-CoA-carboxylase] ligase